MIKAFAISHCVVCAIAAASTTATLRSRVLASVDHHDFTCAPGKQIIFEHYNPEAHTKLWGARGIITKALGRKEHGCNCHEENCFRVVTDESILDSRGKPATHWNACEHELRCDMGVDTIAPTQPPTPSPTLTSPTPTPEDSDIIENGLQQQQLEQLLQQGILDRAHYDVAMARVQVPIASLAGTSGVSSALRGYTSPSTDGGGGGYGNSRSLSTPTPAPYPKTRSRSLASGDEFSCKPGTRTLFEHHNPEAADQLWGEWGRVIRALGRRARGCECHEENCFRVVTDKSLPDFKGKMTRSWNACEHELRCDVGVGVDVGVGSDGDVSDVGSDGDDGFDGVMVDGDVPTTTLAPPAYSAGCCVENNSQAVEVSEVSAQQKKDLMALLQAGILDQEHFDLAVGKLKVPCCCRGEVFSWKSNACVAI